MPLCSVCKTEYWSQSESEPAEDCWCGDRASGPLWEWDRWAGVCRAVRYRLAGRIAIISDYLMSKLV